MDPYQIYNSFKLLSNELQNEENIPRHLFLNELQTQGIQLNLNKKLNFEIHHLFGKSIKKGEHMTDYELADCVSNLMHLSNQVDEMSKDEMSDLLDSYLPEDISIDKFMSDIVGVPTENFEEILQAWENIRQANIPKTARQIAE